MTSAGEWSSIPGTDGWLGAGDLEPERIVANLLKAQELPTDLYGRDGRVPARRGSPVSIAGADPGGRLSGPDAGWRNMLRNLAADAATADAEAYACGERRLTEHHGLVVDSVVGALLDAVDEAFTALPGWPKVRPSTARGGFTRWHFHPLARPSSSSLQAPASPASNPGHWQIVADDH